MDNDSMMQILYLWQTIYISQYIFYHHIESFKVETADIFLLMHIYASQNQDKDGAL